MASEKKATKRGNSHFDAFLVFFSSFFVYLLTLFPTVGTEDSGELITSAFTLDIAHPPGYPTYTLLGKFFSLIIPFGNVAWRVNLMSAFFGAMAVMILFLIIKKLTKNSAIGIIGSLFFAFSNIFWSQAIRAETYTLHIFFLALITYLLILWSNSQNNKYLLLSAFAVGLSLGNQHLIFLAGIPIFIFVLFRNWRTIINPKIVAGTLFLFILGLSVYAYLPLRTASGPYENPAYIKHEGLHDWESFSHFVNRGIYGGTISLAPETEESSVSQSSQEKSDTFFEHSSKFFLDLVINNAQGFIPFFAKIFEQSFFLMLILFIPGAWFLYKREHHIFWLLTLLLLFYSIIQLKFIGYHSNMHPYTLFSTRPFLLSATLLVSIIGSTGIKPVLESIKKKKKRKITLSAVLFLPIIPLVVNFSANNESNNYIAYDFNRHMLESLPQNAFFISTGRDNMTFPLYYLQKVENVRPDVETKIYYSRKTITKEYLTKKKVEKSVDSIFIDLLPHNYGEIDLIPYNFVYQFGDDPDLPFPSQTQYKLRGIKKSNDYHRNKLTGLYYLKMSILNPDQTDDYFHKVKTQLPPFQQFDQFMNDYLGGAFTTGMF